jgi:hypothetical protein
MNFNESDADGCVEMKCMQMTTTARTMWAAYHIKQGYECIASNTEVPYRLPPSLLTPTKKQTWA